MTEQPIFLSGEVCLDNVVISKNEEKHALAGIEYSSGYPTIHLLNFSGEENLEQAVLYTLCHETLHFALVRIGVEIDQSLKDWRLLWRLPSLDKLDGIWLAVGNYRGVEQKRDETGLPNFLVNYRLPNMKYGQQSFLLTLDLICDELEELFKGVKFEEDITRNYVRKYFQFRDYLPEFIRQRARDRGVDKL